MKPTMLCAATILAMTTGSALAQGAIFSAETSIPGNSTHGTMVAIAGAVQAAGLGEVQIQDGQTLTKSLLNIATGKTDMATLPNAALTLLQTGAGPYARLGEEAGSALADDVRALIGFQPSNFVPIAFDDTGIDSWEEFEGKRVFVGPPSGAFSLNAINLIRAVTGLEAGEDYEAIRVDWNAAVDDMLDRKFDVMIMSAPEPSPAVQQMAASGNITMMGIPSDVTDNPRWIEEAGIVAASVNEHGTESYESGVSYKFVREDGKMNVLSANLFVGVHESMDEEVAYGIVSALMANMDAVEASAAFMPNVGLRKAIGGLAETPGLKLHPGAVRALEEHGIDIPNALK